MNCSFGLIISNEFDTFHHYRFTTALPAIATVIIVNWLRDRSSTFLQGWFDLMRTAFERHGYLFRS